MNYSDDFKFKNYFSSRNRSLTKDQKSILDFYQEKVSLESFSELDQLNDYKNISLEIGFGVGDILLIIKNCTIKVATPIKINTLPV